ncbi:MAG: RNA-binding S4 domain-containing protein [Bacteroidales bacterium]
MKVKIEENLRIDKWLWAVRIFKTRTLAASECNNGRVTIMNMNVKPSRLVKIGDEVSVRFPVITRTYKVKGLLAQRLSAEMVKEFVEDITPQEELDKLELAKYQHHVWRDAGEGRPSKKDRRDLEKFGYIQ